MSKLIALVTVVTFVDGQRQEFAPGSELPELPAHDVQELKRMKAVEDPNETVIADKASAKTLAKAQADFDRERQAVRAINDSIQGDAPKDDATAKTDAPASKKR